jgi:hypothetical protein
VRHTPPSSRPRKRAGRLAVIEGPAEIGKTRLLAEPRTLSTEFEVLSARAGELEGDFAFGVARQLFEAALVVAPRTTPSRAAERRRSRCFHGLYRLAATLPRTVASLSVAVAR